MPRKTSKTSHVMNLITSGAPEAEEGQEIQVTQGSSRKETGTAAAPEGQKAAPENKVIVVNETSENEKLSNEIKNRLEARLEAEVAEAAKDADALAAELHRAGAGAPAVEPGDMAAASAARNQAAEEAAQAQVSAAEVPEAAEEDEDEAACHMVNVMEKLLAETDLIGQMKQYGVCTCRRCQADVQALVLTRLPAKYVIVGKTETSPIIGYYESRYRTPMFTEIMKACLTVKDSPRH